MEKLPEMGLYLVMLRQVAKTAIRVCFAFVTLLLAFFFTFTIQFWLKLCLYLQKPFNVSFKIVNRVSNLILPKKLFFTFSFLQKYHITLKFNFAFIAKSTYLSLYIFLFGKLISYSITISKVYILRWINSHSILYLVWCGYFISRQPNKFFCKDKICKWQHS